MPSAPVTVCVQALIETDIRHWVSIIADRPGFPVQQRHGASSGQRRQRVQHQTHYGGQLAWADVTGYSFDVAG